MKKKRLKRDFDYYIDEYMYNCRSRKLRPKTMISYEQSLRLFERWCMEEANITEPGQVLDTTIRHYIRSLQEQGKRYGRPVMVARIGVLGNQRKEVISPARNWRISIASMELTPVFPLTSAHSSQKKVSAGSRPALYCISFMASMEVSLWL